MRGPLVREEDGLAYEVEALHTGRRLGLHASDWDNLMGLAYRYGWRPEAGLDHYLRGGRRVLPPTDAQALAEALEGALQNLPPERRQAFRPMGALEGFVEGASPRSGLDTDYERYFSWQRRWIVEEVGKLCQRGPVEIRPI